MNNQRQHCVAFSPIWYSFCVSRRTHPHPVPFFSFEWSSTKSMVNVWIKETWNTVEKRLLAYHSTGFWNIILISFADFVFSGLMVTSAILYHAMHFFHITIDIRNVCVFLAPLFSSFTTVVTYHMTKELKVQQYTYNLLFTGIYVTLFL